jgi:hypothetical protein
MVIKSTGSGTWSLTSRMSVMYWTTCIILIGLGVTGCGSQPTFSPRQTSDLGALLLAGRDEVAHTFTFRNPARVPVRILSVEKSCGCTDVDLPRDRLEPGEEGGVTLRVTAGQTYAQVHVSATLVTDLPEWPRWDFFLKYEAIPPFALASPYHDLGDVPLEGIAADGTLDEQASCHIDVVISAKEGDKPAEPPRVVLASDAVLRVADVKGPTVVDRGNSVVSRHWRYTVSLGRLISPKPGNYSSSARFISTDGAGVEAVLRWRVVGSLTASPASVHFGIVSDRGDSRRRVLLRSTSARPFTIRAVECDDPALTCLVERDDGSPSLSYFLDLTCRPAPGAVGSLRGTLRVHTDDPHMPLVEIPWAVFAHIDSAVGRS